MDWGKDISGCFGIADHKFALHDLEIERAFALLSKLREQGVSWKDTDEAFRTYLQNKTTNNEHIKTQMAKVKKFMEPWLAN